MSKIRVYFQHLASNGHSDWLFVLPGLLLLGLFGLPILALFTRAMGRTFLSYAFAPEALSALKLSLLTMSTVIRTITTMSLRPASHPFRFPPMR